MEGLSGFNPSIAAHTLARECTNRARIEEGLSLERGPLTTYHEITRRLYQLPYARLNRAQGVTLRRLQTGIYPSSRSYHRIEPDFPPGCPKCTSTSPSTRRENNRHQSSSETNSSLYHFPAQHLLVTRAGCVPFVLEGRSETCDTGTVTAIAQSRIRDGELHSNNGSYSARKSKRSRNHVDPTVMAEQMTGHRGSDSIDTLLAYIYSDDKSGAPNSSNNGGNSVPTESRKGKNVRKGAASSSSNSTGAKNSLSSPPPGQAEEKEVVQEGLSEDVINNNFDSSHRRAVFEDAPLCGGGSGGSPNEKERSFSPSFYSDYGTETDLVGSYRVDLSSYSDVDQIQESEFRLVTKKPRRRAQLKKAATTAHEGFHRPLGGGGAAGGGASAFGSSQGTTPATGNGPVEDSTARRPGVHSLESLSQPQPQHQQRNSVGGTPSIRQEPPATAAGGGRQHNYTGSAPPSEPSSPENSDLDSVHSLPVSSGSSVAATMVLQTSYADIARMSCRQGRGGTSNGGGGVVVPLQQLRQRGQRTRHL
ncbi:hypothetical protein HPB50_022912 [Hyalomma asiaticum]|uniref:Uncharacterized protein n=1 Tax=Hyalomma asiaticum TaxID=266040 RepID=A0ACB7SI73_HYAAI|nr:hypothetical protein HPB50_022912 [Hyalomma asiaticum]